VPRNAEVIRQWTILREIERARAGGVTIDELATRCDVTTRTIRRDLQALEEAGFPLFDDKSADDGKTRWLVNGQAFKGMGAGLTLSELSALYFSRTLLASLTGAAFRDEVESAFEKLASVLTPHMRQFLDEMPRVIATKKDAGRVSDAQQGKPQRRKDLTSIIADHGVPYAAQGSVSHWRDLTTKAEKAFAAEGPAFLNVLSPCPRGWRTLPNQSIQIAKLGVQTGFWPLFEVEDGHWRMTTAVRERKPVEEFLKPQGRFKHLFKPENAELLSAVQAEVDRYWEYVEKRCSCEA
jgi:predicted transcriptional regulator